MRPNNHIKLLFITNGANSCTEYLLVRSGIVLYILDLSQGNVKTKEELEEYAKSLLKHALSNKERIKEEAEEKIERYRYKVQQEAKGPYNYYKDLELKAKSVLSVLQISEIEQGGTKVISNSEDVSTN